LFAVAPRTNTGANLFSYVKGIKPDTEPFAVVSTGILFPSIEIDILSGKPIKAIDEPTIVNAVDKAGQKPLDFAISQHRADMVELSVKGSVNTIDNSAVGSANWAKSHTTQGATGQESIGRNV